MIDELPDVARSGLARLDDVLELASAKLQQVDATVSAARDTASAGTTPDRDQIAQHLNALFRHAPPESFISFRAFFHDPRVERPSLMIRFVRCDAPDLLRTGFEVASAAVASVAPAAFYAPHAVFRDATSAKTSNVAAALVLSVECDGRPAASVRKLADVLGPPTLLVASGGTWIDEGGAPQPKLHAHWRLAAPAVTAEELDRVKQTRKRMRLLADSDPTCDPVVHPLRIAGGWHTKNPAAPRLVRIVESNPEREISLDKAFAAMAVAVPEIENRAAKAKAYVPEDLCGDEEDIAAALQVIPNDNLHWNDWNNKLMAIHNATGGAGVDLAMDWSAKSEKDDPEITLSRWEGISSHPADHLGMATLVLEARKTEPGWVKPSLRFDPANWFEAPQERLFPDASNEGAPTAIAPLRAGRVSLSDLKKLPPRQWLYGYKIQRRYVTILASPGGVGKTSFVFAMALACAARRKLLHDMPHRQTRVWVYNLEDDIVELRRRLAAAHAHYDLPVEALDDIRLNSGRDRRFRIVRSGSDGGFIVEPDFAAVIEEMRREAIDVLVVDPYLRSHGVPENDNPAQDEVLRLYAQIAEATNGAILLVHHVKKGAVAGDLDSLRGGSTQGGGARSVLTLAPMSAEEAKATGIPDEIRRSYIRLDDAKNNMAPTAQAEWLFLHNVPLRNGDQDYPGGDHMQVATAWTPPTAEDALKDADGSGTQTKEHEVLAMLELGVDGERYSPRKQDKDRWAGAALIAALGCSEDQAKGLLAGWLSQGRITIASYTSEKQRKSRQGVFVAQGARASSSIFD